MVLHSATHLFYNEEFSHGLRDMSDLDLLLAPFHAGVRISGLHLLDRARVELGLMRPLHYCLRYCAASVLERLIPDEPSSSRRNCQVHASGTSRLMDTLWLKVLGSLHPSARDSGSSVIGCATALPARALASHAALAACLPPVHEDACGRVRKQKAAPKPDRP